MAEMTQTSRPLNPRGPELYARERAALVVRNGGLVYRGYADVARRFLVTSHDAPLHPAPLRARGR